MTRLSANLSLLYGDLPLERRFAAAARDGFEGVECWAPYPLGATAVRTLLRDEGLAFTGMNTWPGPDGMWGLAAIPGQEELFQRSLAEGIEFAEAIGSMTLHMLAGLAGAIPRHDAERCYLGNLEAAVRRAEGSPVRLVIEPLNSSDRPGYFLNSVEQAARIVDRFGADRLQIMFDCYHVQSEQGAVFARIERNLHRIAHVQIAGVPGRHEPDSGEIDYRWLLAALESAGYQGWVGAEYVPRAGTTEGLRWRSRVLG